MGTHTFYNYKNCANDTEGCYLVFLNAGS